MNRVYLLLRDNTQSGPYAFDELLQQQLLASDLIWVEGKSTAWAYPYEIEDLKGSLTGHKVEAISLAAVTPVAAKTEKPVIEQPKVEAEKELPKIPSKPLKKRKDEIELRAEELRKKAMAFSHYHKNYQPPVFHESEEFRPYVNENDAVYFVHHKNQRRAPVGEVLVAAMVLGLIVLGWYGGADKYFFQRRSPAVNTVASQMVTNDSHAAALSVKEQPQEIADTTNVVSSDSNLVKQTIDHTAGYTNSHSSPKSAATLVTDSQAVQNNNQGIVPETPAKEIEKPVVAEKKKQVAEEVEKDTTDKTDKKEVAEIKKNPEAKKEDNKQAEVKEEEDKKKGLGGVLKGLFGKKKKDKE
jgi:hypothetical protein